MPNVSRRFLNWLPLGVAVTLLTGLFYTAVQQVYRQEGNDPQIQISQEIVRGLEAGEDPKSLESTHKVELADTESPFVIVYGEDEKIIASSVTFEGNDPKVPSGSLHQTDGGQQSRITWAPSTDAREAIVIDHFATKDGKSKGYIVVGRSLKETEQRERLLLEKTAIGLAVTLVATFLATLLVPAGSSLGAKKP